MPTFIMSSTNLFDASTPNATTYDTVVGANGSDTIYNDFAGTEYVYTTNGTNIVHLNGFGTATGGYWYGGSGSTTVDTIDSLTDAAATTGSYYLIGGTGQDTITGGGSFCVISVDAYGCTMTGSAASNADNFFYDNYEGGDTVHGGLSATNYFDLTGGSDTVYGGNHGDFYNLSDYGGNTVHGGNGNDVFHVGTRGNDSISLGSGTDTVWALGVNNEIFVGGSGNDTFFVGAVDATHNVQVTGGSGSSIINAADSQGVNYLTPSTGSGTNIVEGGNYSNHIYGNNTTGLLEMRGGSTTGGDEMVGGKGTSVFIFGGAGDFATSGSGAGVFDFNSAADAGQHIYDFSAAKDSFNIATNGFDGLTAGETLTPGVNLINGTGPVSATPTFVYHSDALYYYSNGTGGASPVLLAALIGGPATLGANNIHIVAGPF